MVRHQLCKLACVNAAEAPSDQTYLAAMAVAEFVHEILHPVLHALAQAEIAALTPALYEIAAAPEKRAQWAGRRIRCNEPGQHKHRMAVAHRRQREQRQRAEESTELVQSAGFQEHQRFGRRL